jgi:S-methylmethionine-dependent homocysteine/selenocysteine methylase
MKRISVLILVLLVVVLAAGAVFLFLQYNGQVQQKQDLNDNIVKNQQIISNNAKAIAAKNQEAATLANQLALAQADLAALNFPADAQSIEYDRIFFKLATEANLKVDQIAAGTMKDVKEGDAVYQAATFTVSVSGKPPKSVFLTTSQSTEHNTAVVNSILAFVNKLATNEEFSTAFIDSVNITSPAPMTQDEIASLESVDDVESPSAVITVTIWTIKGA